jgi:hypothetical protein
LMRIGSSGAIGEPHDLHSALTEDSVLTRDMRCFRLRAADVSLWPQRYNRNSDVTLAVRV